MKRNDDPVNGSLSDRGAPRPFRTESSPKTGQKRDPFLHIPADLHKKRTECEGEEAFLRGEDLFFGKNGVQRDPSLAVSYYEEAARQGVIPAVYALALCYLEGQGVTADPQRAVMLLKMIAKELPDACYMLGVCYSAGRGVLKNHVLACFWLKEAYTRAASNQTAHPLAEKLHEELASAPQSERK